MAFGACVERGSAHNGAVSQAKQNHRLRAVKACCRVLPSVRTVLATSVLAALVGCAGTRATRVPHGSRSPSMLSRQDLFAEPDRTQLVLSPDGVHLALLANTDRGPAVRVVRIGKPDEREDIVSRPASRLAQLRWSGDGRFLLVTDDPSGRERPRLVALDVTTGNERQLSASDEQASVLAVGRRNRGEVAVGIAAKDRPFPDVFVIDLASGARRQLLRNDGYSVLLLDDELRLRVVARTSAEGGLDVFRFGEGRPSPLYSVAATDLVESFMQVDASGEHLFVGDARRRDKAALVRIDLATSEGRVLAEDPSADIVQGSREPQTGNVDAVSATFLRRRWIGLTDARIRDFELLRQLLPGDLDIVERSSDDRVWLLFEDRDAAPPTYHVYDRANGKLAATYPTRSALDRSRLHSMKAVAIRARDGLLLPAYLTTPRVPAGKPPPLVLYVHGGPWARDTWGYYGTDQLLADRGYSVLRVNYRGSTGLGKAFVNAANQQWAGKMQDDLHDAVAWAIGQGVADPKRVAIVGGSYGGYAVMVALTKTPRAFACGVSRAGFPNLVTYFTQTTAQRKAFLDVVAARLFDPRTDEGRAELVARSHIVHVANLERPLLLVHGERDPRVRTEDVVEFADRGAPHTTLATFADEGHTISRAENQVAYHAMLEEFLGRCIGGRVEPRGGDVDRSSLRIRAASAR
jgi:dipeptidyl aminopeptidase/acylaminoacyl peptidase